MTGTHRVARVQRRQREPERQDPERDAVEPDRARREPADAAEAGRHRRHACDLRRRNHTTTPPRLRPTNRMTSPWMIIVRLLASSGGKIDGSSCRPDVPLISAAEEQGGEAHADRGVSAKQRRRDPDEPDLRDLDVTRPELELPAEDVARPAERREPTGDRHREEVLARDRDAARARGLRVEPDGAHLEAERRAVDDDPVDERASRPR